MLPNMTWGQPTYYVIQMVANSYQPYNVLLSTSAVDLDGKSDLSAVAPSDIIDSCGAGQC